MVRCTLLSLIVSMIVVFPVVAQGQSHTGQPIVLAVSPDATTVSIDTSPTVVDTPDNQVKRPVMKILQRRKMGLTVRNIVKVLKDMKAEGSLDQYRNVSGDGTVEVDVSTLAVAVIDRISVENPEGWIDWENIDWDAIIAFVEKIIELILKFLPLFL